LKVVKKVAVLVHYLVEKKVAMLEQLTVVLKVGNLAAQ
jgi:hypothetical protein